jgi:MFS family permease
LREDTVLLDDDLVIETPRSMRTTARTLFLVALGGTVENFEFFVFALFVPVISRLFFPPGVPEWVAQMQTFGIFAAGNLARPLGGIVLAHFGDLYGRKTIFTFSMLLMAAATLGIAATPTYATLGAAAPASLLLLRMLQGTALGGELPGAWTFVAEHSPERHVGFASGILTGGLAVGNLLGVLSGVLVNSFFRPDEVMAFAWRLPFLASGILALIAVYLRRWLTETPIFREMERKRRLATELPLRIILRDHQRAIMTSLGLAWMVSVIIVIVFVMTPTLLQSLYHIASRQALQASTIATVGLAIGCLCGGMIADLVSSGLFFLFGAPLLAACTYLLYVGLPAHPDLLFPLYALAGLSGGVIAGVPIALVNSFPPAVRFTGVSFSYNIGFAVFSGVLPPLIALGLRVDPLAHAHALMLGCLAAFVVGIVMLNDKRSASS